MLGRSNKKHSQARCQRYLLGFQSAKNINTLPVLKMNEIFVVLEKVHEEMIKTVFTHSAKCLCTWLALNPSIMERTLQKLQFRVLAGFGNLIQFLMAESFSCVHIDGIICNPDGKGKKFSQVTACHFSSAFHCVSLWKTAINKKNKSESLTCQCLELREKQKWKGSQRSA